MASRVNPGGPGLARPQSGVALITALLVVALATVTAVAMTTRQQLDIRRTENILHADQAYLDALGVEAWARGLLSRDMRREASDKQVDSLDEPWAKPLAVTKVTGGQVSGYIEELQARFNLNNLYVPPGADAEEKHRAAAQLEYLKRLLQVLNLDPRLAQAVADWLDADLDVRFPDGAEDGEYLDRDQPYRTANSIMASVSELRLVKGVTDDVYAALAPYVTALPTHTAINVNTAPAPVLDALFSKPDAGQADEIIARRKRKAFAGKADFLHRLGPAGEGPGAQALAPLIDVHSRYFLARGDVLMDKSRLRLFSLIREQTDGGTRVLARSMGAY